MVQTRVDAAGLTQWPVLQHIYHQVPVNSGLESHRAPEWNFCIYSNFPHFSQLHHMFLTESPRCSRYSYKTIHPSCHWHFTLTRSTEGWLKWVLSQCLSVQSFQSWDVSQLLKEHVGMGGGSFVSISVSIFVISCKNRVFHLWLLCLKMHINEDRFHKCR